MNKGRLFVDIDYTKKCVEPDMGPFFIYNHNNTILYYTTNNVKDLTEVLEIKVFIE
jgi:hypothetical protein